MTQTGHSWVAYDVANGCSGGDATKTLAAGLSAIAVKEL